MGFFLILTQDHTFINFRERTRGGERRNVDQLPPVCTLTLDGNLQPGIKPWTLLSVQDHTSTNCASWPGLERRSLAQPNLTVTVCSQQFHSSREEPMFKPQSWPSIVHFYTSHIYHMASPPPQSFLFKVLFYGLFLLWAFRVKRQFIT